MVAYRHRFVVVLVPTLCSSVALAFQLDHRRRRTRSTSSTSLTRLTAAPGSSNDDNYFPSLATSDCQFKWQIFVYHRQGKQQRADKLATIITSSIVISRQSTTADLISYPTPIAASSNSCIPHLYTIGTLFILPNQRCGNICSPLRGFIPIHTKFLNRDGSYILNISRTDILLHVSTTGGRFYQSFPRGYRGQVSTRTARISLSRPTRNVYSISNLITTVRSG